MPSRTDNVDDVTAADHNTQAAAIKGVEASLGVPGSPASGSTNQKLKDHDHDGGDGESAALNVGTTFALKGDLTPTQITADQNNYAPTNHATHSIFRLSTDASRNITGLAGGAEGRIVLIMNVGGFDIVLQNASASSTAANRFAFNANVTLKAGQGILLVYDTVQSRWVNPATSVADHGSLTGVTIDQHHARDHGRSQHSTSIRVQDEGGTLTDILDLDFTGSGVSVTFASGKATITIPGGGVGSTAMSDLTDVSEDAPTVGNILIFQEDTEGDEGGLWVPGMPETDHGNFSGLNNPDDHPWAALAGHGHTLEELFGFVRKYKSVDQSLTVSSTTFQNVTDLSVSLAADEIWWFEAMLRMNSANATMDAKFKWTVPAGCTMEWGVPGQGSNFTQGFMTAGSGQTPTGFLAAGDSGIFGSAAAVNYGLFFMGWIYMGSTAGTVQLQAAQNTSDAGVLKVLQHSMLRLWRQEG
jgi:hypothetical protein